MKIMVETSLQKRGREISKEYGLSKPMTMPMDYAAKRVSCLLARLRKQIDTSYPVFRRILFSQAPLAPDDIWNKPEVLALVDIVLNLIMEFVELKRDDAAILQYLQKQLAETNRIDIERTG